VTWVRIGIRLVAAVIAVGATAAHLHLMLQSWPEPDPRGVPLAVLALAGAAVWPLTLLPAAAVVNAALLALASSAQIAAPAQSPPFGLGWLRFGEFMDAPGVHTPLLYASRAAVNAATGGISYFQSPLATVVIAAVAATAFARAVGALWGRNAAIVAVAALVSERWFLNMAVSGDNAGTVLLPCALAGWTLATAVAAPAGIAAGLRVGILATLAVITALYSYLPARVSVPGIVFLAACWGAVAAWRRGVALRYCAALVLPLVTIMGVLFWSGGWDASVLGTFGFRPRGAEISRMPETMTVEASVAPDMPLWYGQAGAVYRRRPTGELLAAVRIHWSRVWNVVATGRFPGEQYAQALFVLGASVAAWRGWRGFVVLAVWCAACAMPYLLVGSPADFRRGIATVVPFAAGIGLGVLWLAGWLPRVLGIPGRWRDGVAVGVAVLALACVRWPHEASGLIGSGNAWCQNDPPVHTLTRHPMTGGRRAIFVRHAPQPAVCRCRLADCGGPTRLERAIAAHTGLRRRAGRGRGCPGQRRVLGARLPIRRTHRECGPVRGRVSTPRPHPLRHGVVGAGHGMGGHREWAVAGALLFVLAPRRHRAAVSARGTFHRLHAVRDQHVAQTELRARI
jgi:hypothetical protein